MDNILDYVIDIKINEALPIVNKSYLKNVGVIVEGKTGQGKKIVEITSPEEIATYTDDENVIELFNAGMKKIYLVLYDLDEGNFGAFIEFLKESDFKQKFWTLIMINFDGFSVDDLYELRERTGFNGILAMNCTDKENYFVEFVKKSKYCGFYSIDNNPKNMLFAFGKLLSNTFWNNCQYIEMPINDNINLGEAESLFENRFSFVLNSENYGNRLAFFGAGGQAIVAPYIIEEFKIDLQARGLNYIKNNNPSYTITEAGAMEVDLKKVLDRYIENKYIEYGDIKINIALDSNFVAEGKIRVKNPTALWRVKIDLTEE